MTTTGVLEYECPACRAPISGDAASCHSCGAVFDTGPEEPQAPAAPPTPPPLSLPTPPSRVPPPPPSRSAARTAPPPPPPPPPRPPQPQPYVQAAPAAAQTYPQHHAAAATTTTTAAPATQTKSEPKPSTIGGFQMVHLLGILMMIAGVMGATLMAVWDAITKDYHIPGPKTFAVVGACCALFFIGLIMVLKKLKTE